MQKNTVSYVCDGGVCSPTFETTDISLITRMYRLGKELDLCDECLGTAVTKLVPKAESVEVVK